MIIRGRIAAKVFGRKIIIEGGNVKNVLYFCHLWKLIDIS